MRTSHTGVKLKRRSNGSWIGRWIDPDTGAEKQQSMEKIGRTTAEGRRTWAIEKMNQLRERREDIASGASPKTETAVDAAIESFFKANPQYRPNTVSTYRQGMNKLAEWARIRGLRLVEDLTLAKLSDFRTWLINQPPRRAMAKGRKGEKTLAVGKLCSASNVNKDVASVSVLLHQWRRSGLTPKLSTDDINDALRKVPADRPIIAFARPPEIRQLLSAAIRHDSACFNQTRAEHDGLRPKGTTPRHDEVAAFVLFMVLTGCRFSEAQGVRWNEVDLNAQGGRGEIYIPPERSKTKRARMIDLGVSPVLKALVRVLMLKRGDSPLVFGVFLEHEDSEGTWMPRSRTSLEKARERLQAEYGAPAFTWKLLRQTCGTFLANAPGIFGAASAYREAKQLGHSVAVAEKHYLGVVHVAPDAKTLEAAMEIESLAEAITTQITEGRVNQTRALG